MQTRTIAAIAASASLSGYVGPTLAGPDGTPSAHLDLPVVSVVDRYPPYQQFCQRRPLECRLDGQGVLQYDARLMAELREVSATVNRDIRFALDRDQHASEDYWTLPDSGYGDCEDLALEKRSRLVRAGHAAGALRLAFVQHRRNMTSHCVLTVETTHGTFLLDSDTDAVELWSTTPYNYESRERQDGRWDRFDQLRWRFNGNGDSGQ